MAAPTSTLVRLYVAGVDALSQPLLAGVDVDVDVDVDVEGHASTGAVNARPYIDPVRASGRDGAQAGSITGLVGIDDVAGGGWLLASVERGRPRLIDREGLGVVALLGRRREWRGSAATDNPFLPIVCDRRPVVSAGRVFVLSRAPNGATDLVRLRPGAAIERWSIGVWPAPVELHASGTHLALSLRSKAQNRAAIVDVTTLVPGACPLTDPRDVELSLAWRRLPASVAGVCDLLGDARSLRVIEAEGGRWRVSEIELESGVRRATWVVARPRRWLIGGGMLWVSDTGGCTRFVAGEGPSQRSDRLGDLGEAVAVELDRAGHPWLWRWLDAGVGRSASELERVDGLALEQPGRRWRLDAGIRAQQLVVAPPRVLGDPATVRHADELAELLGEDPGLAEAWAGWLGR